MRQKFNALNGLRILAALAVISFHYGTRVSGFAGLPRGMQNMAENGAVALPFFYVLSGFVLAHAYCGRSLEEKSEKADFYTARFSRLFPAYFLAFLLFLPMAAAKFLLHPAAEGGRDVHTFVGSGLLTLFGLQAWTPFSQAWNGPAWSVSVEVFFYILFPFALPAITRMRPGRLALLLGSTWLTMISLTLAHEFNVISAVTWSRYFMYQPLFWLSTFLIGIATYRFAGRWSQAPDAFATTVSVGALFSLVLLAGGLRPEHGDFLVNGGAAPLIAVIVLAFSHPRCLSSRLMGSRVLSYLGGISYAIYILQNPVWHMWEVFSDKIWRRHAGDTVAGWQFAVYLVLLAFIAIVVQHAFEHPLQQWLRSRRGKAATALGRSANRPVAA